MFPIRIIIVRYMHLAPTAKRETNGNGTLNNLGLVRRRSLLRHTISIRREEPL